MSNCESCGCHVEGLAGDATCRGCGLLVCQSCCDVWEHIGNGLHGMGNPADEVKRLRKDIAAREALK